MKHIHAMVAAAALLLSGACSQTATFSLSSPAVKGDPQTGFHSKLQSSGRIDAAYAAGDKEPLNTKSFPFTWRGLPGGTRFVALMLDDPDAKPVMRVFKMPGESFIHWTAADIDPAAGGLEENASAAGSLVQGKNSSGSVGYVGPRPPSDIPGDARKPLVHIYRLTVYALSGPTGLKEGFAPDEFERAIGGKVIGKAQLLFSYSN
ncbi:MAG: YbhB/YbcL family Raf kinase inhibitor-like protein [Spirochaetes bacterium]|nr:YbhB/YbcL family Raf kinase inhibitor-like protein [Spirochaetota bacterium]